MNIVKIENVKKINNRKNGLTIETGDDFFFSRKNTTIMIVLSDEDFEIEQAKLNSLKLRGYSISIIMIPKHQEKLVPFKESFVYDLLKCGFNKDYVITYY